MLENYKKKYEGLLKAIIFYIFLILINKKKVIIIDNIINESDYQDEINFSNFETKYKIVAIYYPPIGDFDKNRTKYKSYKSYKLLIKHQIQLAKNHGIFGFGIIHNCLKSNEEIFNLFTFEEDITFPFFIILDCNWYDWNDVQQNNKFLNQNIINEEINQDIKIDDLEKYFLADNYIKLKEQPILGISYSSFLIPELKSYIKKITIENEKGFIHIIGICFGKSKFNTSLFSKTIINSIVEFPSQNISAENNLNKKYFYNFYYNNLYIKENFESKRIKSFLIVNGCKPEKFYIIFKEYLKNIKSENDLLLFNAWNNYKGNCFLEPNEKFGYSYLNYISKALFQVNNELLFELFILRNKCKIAVQIHIFYDDLIEDIINKVNNIPAKFDLFITITSKGLYDIINNYVKEFSKAINYEILILKNKGRDVLPFLTQIRTKFRRYKYLCHIHTKKSKTSKIKDQGFHWRKYLYNNLLGNGKVISEFLYDFEKDKKLGFIFPEAFFGIIKHFYLLTNGTKYWMNFLASKLFINCKIGKLLNFPAGNMFWAKVEAIFQIFLFDFSKYFPNENNQTNDTIMHGIERIWLYLVKYNHFFYKSIFKFF